jgi:toxin ParE1/3/4
MALIFRSPRAVTDILEIVERIANDNPTAAGRFLEEIDRLLTRLSEFPGLGPARDELLPGLRSIPHSNYLLFYRPVTNGIELVRVLHGARDLEELFKE